MGQVMELIFVMIGGVISLSACSSGVPTDLQQALNMQGGGGRAFTHRARRQVDDDKMKD